MRKDFPEAMSLKLRPANKEEIPTEAATVKHSSSAQPTWKFKHRKDLGASQEVKEGQSGYRRVSEKEGSRQF